MCADSVDLPVLVLLRRELRLHDNPLLATAAASGRAVVPVFILDDAAPGRWALGGAQRWWLHHSLTSLSASLAARGLQLVLRRGPTAAVLRQLVEETGAASVVAGQPIEPWARGLMPAMEAVAPVTWVRTVTLLDPDAVRTGGGTPYGVFTPFAKACRAQLDPDTAPAAPSWRGTAQTVPSDPLDSWNLLPRRPDWAGGLRAHWIDGPGGAPGEAGGEQRLKHFVQHGLEGYADTRNSPGQDGSSMLSPRLHWGELSPRDVWRRALSAPAGEAGPRSWTSEILWREFSANLLWHHPDLPDQPLRPEFAAMPWRDDPASLAAWRRGRTGVPIVDAGMRQLWQTGWMHNRVRMIAASLLIKHLLIPWQEGEAWFWDCLVDADLASNSAQWQWVAGSGADAAPYFRIFNPVLQGRKFDPDGAYVRHYVPELARLPTQHLHAPWEAPALLLEAAKIRLGVTYPTPIVDLAAGRDRALAAFQQLRVRAA